jgi:hypothetical protein
MHSPILIPLIALVLWSFVMWAWLYATRIPAIVRNKIVFDPHRPVSEFHARIPASVRWKADNYNNLMEQPTLFYAVALTLALLDAGRGSTPCSLGFMWFSASRIVWFRRSSIASSSALRFSWRPRSFCSFCPCARRSYCFCDVSAMSSVLCEALNQMRRQREGIAAFRHGSCRAAVKLLVQVSGPAWAQS